MICIFFTSFFTTFYIVERLLLQTAYELNNGNSSFLSLKSEVSNQERVIMAHVRYLNILANFRYQCLLPKNLRPQQILDYEVNEKGEP